jgi:PGF-CTERM protein
MSQSRLAVLAAVGCLLLVVLGAFAVGAAGTPVSEGEMPALDTQTPTAESDRTNVSVANATVWTGPASVRDELTSAAAVREHQRSGALLRDATVAMSDPFVLELRIPGFSERLAATKGPNATVRFFRATHGPDSVIRFESQFNPQLPEVALGVNRTAATTVVADRANETYYLVMDPPAMRLGTKNYDGTSVNWSAPVADSPSWYVNNLPFGLNVTIDGGTWTFRGNGTWHELDRIVVFDESEAYLHRDNSDVISVPRDESVQLSGDTNLAPGTELTVRLSNRSDGGPTLTTTAVVSGQGHNASDLYSPPDHPVSASLSTASLEPNATFDLEVVRDGVTLDRADGVTSESADDTTPIDTAVTDVTVWTAPQDADDRLTDLSAIQTARLRDSLTRADSRAQNHTPTVVWNDTLVLELRAPGLAQRMAAIDGPNPTVRFFELTYSENSSITLWETNSPADSQPLAARLNRTAATTAVVGPLDTIYLVVDPTVMRVGFCEPRCGPGHDIDWKPKEVGRFDAPRYAADSERFRNGSAFAVNARIDGTSANFSTDDDGDTAPLLSFEEPEVSFSDRTDGRVEFSQMRNLPVQAETNLAPGTTVSVRLTNRSDGGQTLVDHDLVTENGTTGIISADFDTRGLPIDTTFTLEFVANGHVLTRTDGVIQWGPPSTSTAAPTDVHSSTPRDTTTRRATPTPTQTESTTPTAGTPTTAPSDPPAGSETPTATSQPTPTPSPTATDSSGTETSGGSGPGFGLVVTVAALLAAAALARVRRT